ncbi:hypothetical protein A2960_03240 [Candidatus Gottesmanbacteria bacterium RIFCSPLOWO2_01_FULL_39_12b]|uniref:GHMP kinase N-terminal domain-containing protein n=1 Tax=Candidatus Gottesmanbacteria bacterium RIFCSPLOWO2_01_FULL_39_12b TaxID=1798388 RepID=A0A1F6ARR6_9BACT|nr:MAG: hypothetical protein A2960_03240 [Candidatus Gottesmanbacteria bacterium RIFCSPLOWO2_01_FULL_39_12b]
MVITKTPHRITLGGGGTDITWYSQKRGGAWISAAIDQYVYLKVKPLPNKNITDVSNQIIRECLKLTKTTHGVEIISTSDIPGKSGLGGSGAFTVGLLHALYKHQGINKSKENLAKEAYFIERIKLQKPIGPQDQYITALGSLRYFEMDKKGNVQHEPLELMATTIFRLKNNLLFFSTGVQRDASLVLSDVKKSAETQALDKIKEIGKMAKTYLLKNKLNDFGKTFHEHWLIKRKLSDKVTNSYFDEIYDEAMRSGALGGKIMGAGGGGWFVFYIDKNKSRLRNKMRKMRLKEHKFGFDWEGTRLAI